MTIIDAINSAFDGRDPDAIKKLRVNLSDSPELLSSTLKEINRLREPKGSINKPLTTSSLEIVNAFNEYITTKEGSDILRLFKMIFTKAEADKMIKDIFNAGYKSNTDGNSSGAGEC